MSAKTIAIGLASDRIDVLLCQGGRVLAARRVDVTIDQDRDKWCRAVKDASRPLRAIIEELAATGCSATVLFRSPTECSEHAAHAMKSPSDAAQAALLSCADAFPCPLDLAPHRAVPVGRDAARNEAQTHVVVAADCDEMVSALSTMTEDAGLHFSAAVPINAVLLASACQRGLRHANQLECFLYVGEARSFLVISSSGSVLFARSIGVGTEAMIAALTKPIRTGQPEPLTIDRTTARDILFTHGLADRHQIVHVELGLTGGQILPLLAPVLQRYIVEVRQSLRFGLNEELRRGAAITLGGPGACVPGLAELLASELAVAVSLEPRTRLYDWTRPHADGGELADALAQTRLLAQLALQPLHIARFRQASRTRRMLWTGAVLALTAIGAEAWHYENRLTMLRGQAGAATSASVEQQQRRTTIEKLVAAQHAADGLQTIIAREVGTAPNVRACMQELAAQTPPSIRLTSITMHQSGTTTVGAITGYALQPESAGSRTQLEPFIDALQQSPLFENVVLSSVQMGSLGEVTGQRFEATLAAIAVPRETAGQAATVTGVLP